MDVLDGFDPVLEHRVRLAVGVLLAGHGEISFARLKQQLSLTDGNLGAQLRRLEDDGYIALRRAFVERKPVTWYRLTAKGCRALDRHLAALQGLIAAVAPSGCVAPQARYPPANPKLHLPLLHGVEAAVCR